MYIIMSLTKRPGHRLFICYLHDLSAELPISEIKGRYAAEYKDSQDSGRPTLKVMCYATFPPTRRHVMAGKR